MIPLDEPIDLVAIRVETYTAKRAYQIASASRSRGVPVVMVGFHATLCPHEVATYADVVGVGEAASGRRLGDVKATALSGGDGLRERLSDSQ